MYRYHLGNSTPSFMNMANSLLFTSKILNVPRVHLSLTLQRQILLMFKKARVLFPRVMSIANFFCKVYCQVESVEEYSFYCHCEERSDEPILCLFENIRLPRPFGARNDNVPHSQVITRYLRIWQNGKELEPVPRKLKYVQSRLERTNLLMRRGRLKRVRRHHAQPMRNAHGQ